MKAGFSLEEIDEPEKPRGCYLFEAYEMAVEFATVPGHWLHAALNELELPLSINEELALQADSLSIQRLSGKAPKFNITKKEKKIEAAPEILDVMAAFARGEKPLEEDDFVLA